MWLDRQRGLVVYDAPDHIDWACKNIPGTKPLNGVQFAFPYNLRNLQLARWRGLSVPAPLADYDWPGQYKPFEAQRVMANFMCVHPRCHNLSDMGTGKTLAALWASDFIMTQQPGTRTLIASPLSTLFRVWSDAIFQHFLGRRRCVVVHGSKAKRIKLLATEADYYIINHDGVSVIKNELAQRQDIQIVVIDEASGYRDGTTKRHRTARTFLAGRQYLWLMTGTPCPNGPLDAYGLSKLVANSFGESFVGYRMRVMEQVGKWKWLPRPGAMEAAYRMLAPNVRFDIDQCIDLPEQTTQRRDVELSVAQKDAYEELKRRCVLMLENGKQITAVHEAALRLKLIQVSCGAIYDAEHTVSRIDAAPRIEVLREVMQEAKAKIIVFAPLTSVVNMLYDELSEDYQCAVVNGPVGIKERAQIFRDFQEQASPRVLIADPGTMSHGLTLTAAATIVWFGPTDRTELYLQAIRRIDRPGQTRTNVVVQLMSTKIEREIYRRLENNENLQGIVFELAKGATQDGKVKNGYGSENGC